MSHDTWVMARSKWVVSRTSHELVMSRMSHELVMSHDKVTCLAEVKRGVSCVIWEWVTSHVDCCILYVKASRYMPTQPCHIWMFHHSLTYKSVSHVTFECFTTHSLRDQWVISCENGTRNASYENDVDCCITLVKASYVIWFHMWYESLHICLQSPLGRSLIISHVKASCHIPNQSWHKYVKTH